MYKEFLLSKSAIMYALSIVDKLKIDYVLTNLGVWVVVFYLGDFVSIELLSKLKGFIYSGAWSISMIGAVSKLNFPF